MNDFDVVVVGGGAAGLSAALVLARARRTVLVVDSGGQRNLPAAHMHGYLSRDGMDPRDLVKAGRLEVSAYGGSVVSGRVTSVSKPAETHFNVHLDNGEDITARRLLVATGLRDELPDIEGLRDRWGKDVLHCPYCHGYEVQDQTLGVLGSSPGSVRFAQIVRQWSGDLVYFAPPGSLSVKEREELSARSVRVVEGYLSRVVVERDNLSAVDMHDGQTVPIDALFVPPAMLPNDDILNSLGCALTTDGWVVTDPTGLTSVAGVWVAGNVANPRAQVITAAGEGSSAAIALNADLVDEDVRLAVLEFSGALIGRTSS